MTFANPSTSSLRTGRATPAPGQPAASSTGARRLAAVLLLGQFAFMWGAFFVLAPSIDWPASLGLPASEMLPLLLGNFAAVFTGYTFYLIHALILIPVAVVLPASLGMGATAGRLTLSLGVLTGAAKALGIVRWLFLMPALATAWVAPETSEATRAAISVVFDAFNAYAGGVGEVLGVGFFAGSWTVVLAIVLIRLGARWLGLAGLVAAAGLFSTLPSVLGIESPMLLTLSGIVWQFWTAGFALWLLRHR